MGNIHNYEKTLPKWQSNTSEAIPRFTRKTKRDTEDEIKAIAINTEEAGYYHKNATSSLYCISNAN